MRIAFVANWWYRRGGLGAVMLDEAGALEARGHDVVPFAAAHPENLDASTEDFFPPFVETADGGRSMSARQQLSTIRRLIDNRDAATRFERLIDNAQPDLIHVHNTVRQLSPSVLAVAKRRGLPIVMTMHDYGLICPQGLLLRGGSVPCDPPLCASGSALHAVRNGCLKGSVVASAAGACELATHRRTRAYSGTVDLLIAPSRFLGRLVGDGGPWKDRIRHLPNGIPAPAEPRQAPSAGASILFAGRLVKEKGVDDLLGAARLSPELDVVIAGDGPEATRLRQIAPPSVRFLGHQSGEEIAHLFSQARALVAPSIWLENAPISILEAMRAGRPVIATDMGGTSEMLRDGGGLMVPPGNPLALGAAMRRVTNEPDLADAIGEAGRRSFRERYTLDRHIDGLLAIYGEALASTGSLP